MLWGFKDYELPNLTTTDAVDSAVGTVIDYIEDKIFNEITKKLINDTLRNLHYPESWRDKMLENFNNKLNWKER